MTASPTAWTNTVPGAGGAGRRVRDGGGTPVSFLRSASPSCPSAARDLPPGTCGTPPDPNGVDVGHTRGRGAGMAADVATLAAELAAHADAEARIAAALVELERHPGHVALAAGTSTGVTAARWAAASAQLAAPVGGLRGLPQRARRRPHPARRAPPTAARGHRRGSGGDAHARRAGHPHGHDVARGHRGGRGVRRHAPGRLHRVGAARRPGAQRRWRRPAISTRKAPTPHGSRARWPTSSGRSSTTRSRSPTSPSRTCSPRSPTRSGP